MAKMRGTIVVNTERCKGCELCAVACPFQLIQMSATVNNRGYNYAMQEPSTASQCTGCSACGIVCPDGCISVYRRKEETL